MRPEILYPLFAPLESLKGIGPKIKPSLTRLAGETVWDLLCHLPRNVISRHEVHDFSRLSDYDGLEILLRAQVMQHMASGQKHKNYRKGTPYRIRAGQRSAHDADGSARTASQFLDLVFFHAKPDYLQEILPVNYDVILAGRLDVYQNKLQMVHPLILRLQDEHKIQAAKIQAVYPLAQGVSAPVLGRAMDMALQKIPPLPEWIESSYMRAQGFATFKESLLAVHHPRQAEDATPSGIFRMRLAFDELFANQLMLGLVKVFFQNESGDGRHSGKDDKSARDKICQNLINSLPYQLTKGQVQAFAEIIDSLQNRGRMLRLLQGDVGSGKTIVALLSMLWAAGENGQAALMAPTDILARQHYENFCKLLTPLGIATVLLTGKMRSSEKKQTLEHIEQGSARIIIGTHALFQEQVRYADLCLAVIDEQHRFGVHQRLIFSEKAQRLDMLVMSATPIPRTLMLSYWNNLEISRLKERPQGRKDVITRAFSQSRMDEIVQAVTRALGLNQKIYWVCPLIEESESLNIADVTARAQMLRAKFGDEKIQQLHGKMPVTQKKAAIEDFIAGKAQILVATSVIEVGVDVPDASIMIIEHAERFGLAALHQLRGRVGRGGQESFCLLIHGAGLSAEARARLKIIRDIHDGFKIAELDLQLRGGGDALGIRQSGLPAFRFVDWHVHQKLIAQAHQMAKDIIDAQRYRQSPDKDNIKMLLYLFGHDNAARLLLSG